MNPWGTYSEDLLPLGKLISLVCIHGLLCRNGPSSFLQNMLSASCLGRELLNLQHWGGGEFKGVWINVLKPTSLTYFRTSHQVCLVVNHLKHFRAFIVCNREAERKWHLLCVWYKGFHILWQKLENGLLFNFYQFYTFLHALSQLEMPQCFAGDSPLRWQVQSLAWG